MILRILPLLVALSLVAGCGGAPERDVGGPTAASAGAWEEVLAQARGQTVNWWMYGGDERINAYVRAHVVPAARRLGVTVRPVPVTDTADAVQQVVTERRAGRTSGGSVDLVWINGENFASGKEAGLWLRDWARELPNARYVDWSDPSVATDFQVPVDGQESPWSRAAFVFARDPERMPEPPADLDALLEWAREHPGRFTYPAPPDFTGSAFVRQVVQAKGEDAAFAYLRELQPLMFRAGEVLPRSEAELNELFSAGQVDVAMSYDSAFVLSAVRRGQFPRRTRPFLLGEGALTNVSFVTIPAAAAHRVGAMVVADLLLDPRLQAVKADPDVLGQPTVLDLARLSPGQRRRFDTAASSPHLLRGFGRPVQELPAEHVGAIEERWRREVLR
jgi:putative spermidine/putrescine transport system substrate-binding protein